jgi:ribosome-associated protein
LVRRIIGIMDEKKAGDVVVLDLRDVSAISDYFVFCTAGNARQAQAVSDAIQEDLKRDRVLALSVEGEQPGTWILMDYVDVVVHIFQPQAREYYALETFWGDAKDASAQFTPR